MHGHKVKTTDAQTSATPSLFRLITALLVVATLTGCGQDEGEPVVETTATQAPPTNQRNVAEDGEELDLANASFPTIDVPPIDGTFDYFCHDADGTLVVRGKMEIKPAGNSGQALIGQFLECGYVGDKYETAEEASLMLGPQFGTGPLRGGQDGRSITLRIGLYADADISFGGHLQENGTIVGQWSYGTYAGVQGRGTFVLRPASESLDSRN